VDLATFRSVSPEFELVPDEMIQGTLDEAALEISAVVWGTKWDAGHRYLTAHKLALSPYGTGTRLQAKDGGSTYWTHFEKIRSTVTMGYRVI
jgi:hypothetical protein